MSQLLFYQKQQKFTTVFNLHMMFGRFNYCFFVIFVYIFRFGFIEKHYM